MKKRILLIALLTGILIGVKQGKAQESGIRFEQLGWKEALEKASQEKKLIFTDFYTEWCGPCLSMAEEVFPRMEIGNFYNTHFINLKIDAEKGEGKTLREKYKVSSFPTYLFIDPQSGEIIHRSSSRQEAETFLFTGKSAVTPSLRSPYLEKEYTLGNRSRELLGNYMDYLASVYQREKVVKLAGEYTALPDFSLKNRQDWEVFVKHIGGIDNPQFREVLAHKLQYDSLYGKAEVDEKLYREFNLSLDTEALRHAPDFKGKEFLTIKNQAEQYIRAKEYSRAIPLLDTLMADPGDFKEQLCHYLKFTSRTALYGEPPYSWLQKCAELAQYVAYNSDNRQDAGIHYDYALLLEKLIKTQPEAEKRFPSSIAGKPAYGVKDYSMRPAKLKPKPSAKNK